MTLVWCWVGKYTHKHILIQSTKITYQKFYLNIHRKYWCQHEIFAQYQWKKEGEKFQGSSQSQSYLGNPTEVAPVPMKKQSWKKPTTTILHEITSFGIWYKECSYLQTKILKQLKFISKESNFTFMNSILPRETWIGQH